MSRRCLCGSLAHPAVGTVAMAVSGGNVIRLRYVTIEISAPHTAACVRPIRFSPLQLGCWECDSVRGDVDTRRINVLSNSRGWSQPHHVSLSSTLQHGCAHWWRENEIWHQAVCVLLEIRACLYCNYTTYRFIFYYSAETKPINRFVDWYECEW